MDEVAGFEKYKLIEKLIFNGLYVPSATKGGSRNEKVEADNCSVSSFGNAFRYEFNVWKCWWK